VIFEIIEKFRHNDIQRVLYTLNVIMSEFFYNFKYHLFIS